MGLFPDTKRLKKPKVFWQGLFDSDTYRVIVRMINPNDWVHDKFCFVVEKLTKDELGGDCWVNQTSDKLVHQVVAYAMFKEIQMPTNRDKT